MPAENDDDDSEEVDDDVLTDIEEEVTDSESGLGNEETTEGQPESDDGQADVEPEEVDTETIDPDSEDDAAREGDFEEPAAAGPAEPTASEPTAGTTDPDDVFCSSCGEPIKKQAEICPNCGVRQERTHSTGTSEKNPGIAAVASFFFPGLGDIYNGEFGRGAVIFVGWFVGAFVWTLIIGVIGIFTLGIGLLAAPLYAVVNFVSAYFSYKRAEKINAGEIQV